MSIASVDSEKRSKGLAAPSPEPVQAAPVVPNQENPVQDEAPVYPSGAKRIVIMLALLLAIFLVTLVCILSSLGQACKRRFSLASCYAWQPCALVELVLCVEPLLTCIKGSKHYFDSHSSHHRSVPFSQ
jgi:hypothetical protein